MKSLRTGVLLVSPLLLVLAAAFVVPLLLLVPTSFQEYRPGAGIATDSWTFANYARIFTDEFYREVVLRTIGLGAAVTASCLVLGYPVAYLIVRGDPRWRLPLTLLVIFPLMLNLVVRSFGWIVLLTNRGVVNNLLIDLGLIERPLRLMFNMTGLMIGLTHIYLPFMVLMLVAALQNVPRDVEAAASTLGSSRFHVFRSVTLPLTAPGIIAGSILVFVLTISALVTPRMLGGPTYQVMATLIYDEYMQLLDWPSGSALSFALAISTIFIIWLSSRMTETLGGPGMIEQRPGLAVSSVAMLVILFLQIPVIVVMLASFSETSYLTIPPQGWTLKWFAAVVTDRTYIDAIRNSLILAVGSTAISLVLGVAASYAIFRRMLPGSEALTSLLMAPLIIPSVVIGVALLQYFTLVGMRGSFLVLLIAHVVITVPYIVRSALASLSGIDLAVEEAARVLGANGFTTFRLITLPLIKPGLVAGALFAFVTSMENVPVTIFLAGPRDTTLPILIFTSVEMGVNPSVAAVSTLLIIATAIVLLVAERWTGFHRFV